MTTQQAFLTGAESAQLAEAMNTKYRLALVKRKFSIKVSHEGRAVYVSVLLSNEDESYYYPVEGRILHEEEGLAPRKAALFLIDYIDMYFEEFLLEEDESIYIPIDWTDHQYEATDFQIRGQILNRKLEAMADEWLQQGKH